MTNLLLVAFDLSAPMSGKQFTRMPEDYQRAYLDGLIGRFGATDPMLAKMFGVHTNTVYLWRRRLGVECCGGRTDTADLTGWSAWRRTENRCRELGGLIESEHPEVTVL